MLGLFFDHLQLQIAIIDENVTVGREIFDKIGIGDADALVGGLSVRAALHDDAVARPKLDRGGTGGGAYFGALGVDEDADASGHHAHVRYDAVQTFLIHVRRVETHDIHTRFVK